MNISERERFMLYIFGLLLMIFAYTTFIQTPKHIKIKQLESIKLNIEKNKSNGIKEKIQQSKENIDKLNKNEILNLIQQYIQPEVTIISFRFFESQQNTYRGIEIELMGNKNNVLNSIMNIEKSIDKIYIESIENIENHEEYQNSLSKIVFHNYLK